MEKSTIKFFAVSLVLFLSVPAVNSQWGFGLGKGDNWDLLWSNIGDLDKYDLNKNSNELANNVTPRQTSNPGGTSLRSRYGRFVQSADSSDESDDSSSEEISVGIGETIYNTYLGNKQNDNYDNRLERQPTAGEYNTEGEEYVYNREAGTGSETETDNNGQNSGNSQRQSGSWKSPWTETGSNREGGFTKQNNQDMNYEKRSPHNQRGQQGQIGQGVDQGQRGNTRGQGPSGQQRYHSWADYQRQQQRRNMGEEFEPEDVTPASNGGQGQGQGQGHGRGNGQLGENEVEGNMRQSGAQASATTGSEFEWIEPEDRTTPASVSDKKTTTGTEFEWIEPEDRTTPASVSDKKTTTARQEYEAEDVTTQAPGGSATSGRVTVRGSTTEEYEFEGRKTTTTDPKNSKQSVDTWESGMATNPNKPGQTGQGGKTPDGNFRGRWVDIGERPQQQNVVNSTDKNGWAMYAGSVEGSGPEREPKPSNHGLI
ncbi:dentin matrix acidic phosphoprotein 1-like [Pecten maximus]|uniref:dentin matrix acidic phosphoprotein 1-like n=1 Tax=Pecten maximus TaxID=6579 RepID=UPI001458CB95|nr:dentin matrix acidic phosphoprotein 1-like [Pecten maximus]